MINIDGYRIMAEGGAITIQPGDGDQVVLSNPSLGEFISALIFVNQGEQPALLTARSFAGAVGKSHSAVRYAIKRGKIPGVINVLGDFLIPSISANPGMIDWGKSGRPRINRKPKADNRKV